LDKANVFREAWRVLKNGGRLSISDVVATAELPDHIRNDLTMLSGCISGAETIDRLRDMLRQAGFSNIRLTPKDNSQDILKTWIPGSHAEDYVASYLIEAEKKADT
ncbi:MAG: arsenite methyltransferase, partial [Eubacteriales bacterium]|nr:arsenite methyltransferase [Eubacteriales bacterium]